MTSSPKRILITSVSAGSGHIRAAQAIEAAFGQSHPHIEVKHIDVMNYVSRPFRQIYADGYAFAVNHTPGLWGRLYNFTDQPPERQKVQSLISLVQRHQATDFVNFLNEFAPDLILTTHFLIPQLLAGLPRSQPTIVQTVVTDYELHHMWFNSIVNRYFVACEEMAVKLGEWGVDLDRVVVSGIPVHPAFVEPVLKDEILRKLGLEQGMKTILLLAGGMGLGSLDKTVRALFQLSTPMQIISISGKNTQLRYRLERLVPPSHVKLRNFGYVMNMQDFMTVSDLVVTKPGGLTVSECLVRGNAMLLYSPIPGQEEGNASYIQKIGAGLKADSVQELVNAIENLFASPASIEQMKRRALENSHPRAAYTIAGLAASSLLAA